MPRNIIAETSLDFQNCDFSNFLRNVVSLTYVSPGEILDMQF